jgi:hypothetical protein
MARTGVCREGSEELDGYRSYFRSMVVATQSLRWLEEAEFIA